VWHTSWSKININIDNFEKCIGAWEKKVFNITLDGTMPLEEMVSNIAAFVNGPNGKDWIPVIKTAVPFCMQRIKDIPNDEAVQKFSFKRTSR
jgi:hypothetical protein